MRVELGNLRCEDLQDFSMVQENAASQGHSQERRRFENFLSEAFSLSLLIKGLKGAPSAAARGAVARKALGAAGGEWCLRQRVFSAGGTGLSWEAMPVPPRVPAETAASEPRWPRNR